MRLRGLAAVVILGLRRLVARGEEVRRELPDDLTAKAAGRPRRAMVLLLLPVAAAVVVRKAADDLVCEAAEGAAIRVVAAAAAALFAAKQCVHGHALRAEGRVSAGSVAHDLRSQRRPGKGMRAYTKTPITGWTIAINPPGAAGLVWHDGLQ